MTRPLVTVCVPTYNGAAHVAAALRSALAQTYAGIELLVSDDGSTDGTLDVVREVAQDARVLTGSRLGLVGNLDRCVAAARGEWVKFLFQDDLLDPDCVERMVAAAGPDTRIVLGERRYVYEDVEEWREPACEALLALSVHRRFPGRAEVSAAEMSDAVLDWVDVNGVGEPVAWLARTDAARELGTFERRLVQLMDIEWLYRGATRWGVALVPGPVATFRVHGGSETSRNFGDRHYRTEVLDKLVLRMLYATAPGFAGLRAHGGDLSGLVTEPLRRAAAEAYAAPRDSAVRTAWREVVAGDRQLRGAPGYRGAVLRGRVDALRRRTSPR